MTWPEVSVTKHALTEYLAVSVEHLERGPHMILHRAAKAGGMGSAERKRMAEHLKEQKPRIQASTAGVAIVSSSTLIRGMITAVGWIVPPAAPQSAFATEAEALDWLREKYEARFGPVPSRNLHAPL